MNVVYPSRFAVGLREGGWDSEILWMKVHESAYRLQHACALGVHTTVEKRFRMKKSGVELGLKHYEVLDGPDETSRVPRCPAVSRPELRRQAAGKPRSRPEG